jgi:hypothetical protein
MDGWKTEYTRSNLDTDTVLIVSQGTYGEWCWILWDESEETEITSSAHMFPAPELAATAALEYYEGEWLPEYKRFGIRKGSEK